MSIRTGWDRYFHNSHSRYHLHPYLSLEAAPRWLVDRGVKLLALAVATPDMPGVIRAPGFDWPIHHLLLGAGCIGREP